MSNADAAKQGRLPALEAARDTLAEAIDAAQQRGDGTLAQLMAQYRATLAEIDAIKEPEATSDADAAARRAALRAI